MSIAVRSLVFGAFFALFAINAAGQDLGSSNKLFGTKKKKAPAAAKPASRKPARTRTSASRPSVKKKTEAGSTTAAAKPATEPAKSTAKTPPKTETKTAVIEKPKPPVAPVKKAETVKVPEPVDPAANAKFEDLIETGNTERDRRNYIAAEAAYRRAKLIKPKDSRAVYGLGNLYSDQQRWEEAEAAYRSALEIEPDAAIAHVALSYVLTQPVAAPNLSERYQEAEDLARKAIKLAPSNPLAFDQLGVALELRGLIDSETENAYRRAIKLDPQFAPPHAHLGRLLRRRGQIAESQASYETAVRLASDVPTMILVADVLQSEVRFAESEELLRKAVNDDPKNPAALLLLGRALTALEKYDEAEDVLKRSLAVSDNNFMAHSLLGTLYLRQDRPELAGNALFQALKYVSLNEKRTLARQFEAVGDTYMRSARRREADHAYRQAIALDPERQSLSGKVSSK